jgi:hypothetical protein
MSMIELPVCVLNPHVSLIQSPEPQWPEVHVPDPVADLFQADVFADADSRDVYPAVVPSDPAVAAQVPNLQTVEVLERGQPGRASDAARACSTGLGSPDRAPHAAPPVQADVPSCRPVPRPHARTPIASIEVEERHGDRRERKR